ncbi:hypothetical protein JST97_17035 [bacterium]|nr:hypothetical protein [bacterium]
MSQGRVRVQIPKQRRNTGEVRPYNELPTQNKSDAILLWGTTFLLSACVLVFGAVLVYKNSQAAVAQPEVIQVGSTNPKELLAQSREHFIAGHFSQAVSQARVGLALEQQNPSQPPLEKELRRALGLADLEIRDYGEAVEQFHWLQEHAPAPDDLSHLRLAQRNYRQVTGDALQELEGAQRLSVSGVQDKAYAKASKAVSSLQHTRGKATQVQAGQLVMANIALRQGRYQEALLRLREAGKLGPLTPQQQQVLHTLEGARPEQSPGIASTQMPVVVPRLETGSAYPQSRSGFNPINRVGKRNPSPVGQPEPEEMPESASASQPARKPPHVELPKLQFPGGNTATNGGLPGYQNNNSSNSLPGYNTQTRTKDTLPGY